MLKLTMILYLIIWRGVGDTPCNINDCKRARDGSRESRIEYSVSIVQVQVQYSTYVYM